MVMPTNEAPGVPTPDNYDPLDVRNFQVRGLGPLRKFDGVLSGVPWEQRTGRDSGRKYIVNKLQFTDMNVEQSVEPYIMPTYELEIFAGKNEGSQWSFYGKSVAAVLDSTLTDAQKNPKDQAYVPNDKRPNLKSTFGKRHYMVLADGIDGRPEPPMMYSSRSKKEEPTPCWMCYKIEGIGEVALVEPQATTGVITPEPEAPVAPVANAPTPAPAVNALQQAMALLDGKDAGNFNAVAMADAVVIADAQVMAAIQTPQGQPNSFLDTMIKSGMFTMDAQGIFHRVQQA